MTHIGQKNYKKNIRKNGTLIKKGKNIMKKIIGIVIASLVFCSVGFAEMKRIEEKKFSYLNYHLSTVCVDKYKFVVATSNTGEVSVVQFLEQGVNYNRSARC